MPSCTVATAVCRWLNKDAVCSFVRLLQLLILAASLSTRVAIAAAP